MLTLTLRRWRPYQSIATVDGDAVMPIAANSEHCSCARLFIGSGPEFALFPKPARRAGSAFRVPETLRFVPLATARCRIYALHLLGCFAKVARISLYLLHHSSPVGCLTRRSSGAALAGVPLNFDVRRFQFGLASQCGPTPRMFCM